MRCAVPRPDARHDAGRAVVRRVAAGWVGSHALQGACRSGGDLDRLAGRCSDPQMQRAACRTEFLLDGGRALASGTSGRSVRGRPTGPGYRHAWTLAAAGLDGGRVRPALAPPALCPDRCFQCRDDHFPEAPGPSPARGPRGRTGAVRLSAGSRVTTDRLVTPFHGLSAQSGPREVSPLNFIRGSRSIQRLWAARPSDFGSRGRA